VTTALADHPAMHEELRWLTTNARPPKLRSLLQFAEEEIRLPRGPYRAERFRGRTQPWMILAFDLLDSMSQNGWKRAFLVGPPQSAKTFIIVVYTLHCLFERGETVIFAGRDIDMCKEKWRNDLSPVIKTTRFEEYMPATGKGSRGGDTDEIAFENGANLKFMGGAGGTIQQAAYTARYVVCTEIDKWPAATPGEADPLSLIEKRTDAYGDAGVIIGECTVTEPQGRIWSEYARGTATKIVVPCQRCGEWVSPSRDHLRGWNDAIDEIEARRAAFHCPACDTPWTDRDRFEANHKCRFVHRLRTSDHQEVTRAVHGQTDHAEVWQHLTKDGEVVGDAVRTRTLSFRWSAFNNMFWAQGAIGQDEWAASRRNDEDEAAKDMLQGRWAIPYTPPEIDLAALNPDALERKCLPFGQGFVPPWTDVLAVGIDLGLDYGHAVTAAFRLDGTSHVVNYERIDVPGRDIGPERGINAALAAYKDVCDAGWSMEGGCRKPDVVVVDCGWETETVYRSCRPLGFVPLMGWGAGQFLKQNRTYRHPSKTQGAVTWRGVNCHQRKVTLIGGGGYFRIDADADFWKSWVHARLGTPIGQPTSMTLYQCVPGKARRTFVLHLSAERKRQAWIPGRGTVIVWESLRRGNHYLDALYYAACGAHLRGVRVSENPISAVAPKVEASEEVKAAVETIQSRASRSSASRPYILSGR